MADLCRVAADCVPPPNLRAILHMLQRTTCRVEVTALRVISIGTVVETVPISSHIVTLQAECAAIQFCDTGCGACLRLVNEFRRGSMKKCVPWNVVQRASNNEPLLIVSRIVSQLRHRILGSIGRQYKSARISKQYNERSFKVQHASLL